MYTKSFTAAAAVLAASTLVNAQTFTDCNPLEKDCPSDPAFGSQKINCNLQQGECGAFKHLPGTEVEYTPEGAIFSIEKETNAPTIATDKYIFFGRLDVEIQAAPGQGIVTSAVLQSDCLDEIDWEWVGGDDLQVQTNYFSKGDTSTYDRGAYHPVDHPLTSFHTYSINWTPASVQWIIDGAIIRELKYEDAKGGSAFPQTPMQIKLGTWVAGRKDAPQGTVDWAGGYADFSKGPFNAVYKSISIVDYAGSSGPSSGSVREYIYGDRTGEWESIEVVKGNGSSDDDETTTKTSSHASTKTTEAPKTTTTKASSTHTSEAETTSAEETTLTTVTSAPVSESTGEPTSATSASTTAPADGATETEAPPSAGHRDGVAIGSALLAGAVLAAQFFL